MIRGHASLFAHTGDSRYETREVELTDPSWSPEAHGIGFVELCVTLPKDERLYIRFSVADLIEEVLR
jgi:hypothetical protein